MQSSRRHGAPQQQQGEAVGVQQQGSSQPFQGVQGQQTKGFLTQVQTGIKVPGRGVRRGKRMSVPLYGLFLSGRRHNNRLKLKPFDQNPHLKTNEADFHQLQNAEDGFIGSRWQTKPTLQKGTSVFMSGPTKNMATNTFQVEFITSRRQECKKPKRTLNFCCTTTKRCSD